MNDAKQNYAAMAESEFDLRREVERLRDINKDLLAACEESHNLLHGKPFVYEDGRPCCKVEAAIRKAEGK